MIDLAVSTGAPSVAGTSNLRRALLWILSPRGVCSCCGADVGIEKLEIDHLDGRTWSARAMSRPQRVRRYWREFLDGVRLRALCRSCNAIDGNHRRWTGDSSSSK